MVLQMERLVGTYLEQKFREYLESRYNFVKGNSASGIDFPELLVDMKVTASGSHNLPVLSELPVKRCMAWAILCLCSFMTKWIMREAKQQH